MARRDLVTKGLQVFEQWNVKHSAGGVKRSLSLRYHNVINACYTSMNS